MARLLRRVHFAFKLLAAHDMHIVSCQKDPGSEKKSSLLFQALELEVDELKDLQDTLRELHNDASAKHDDALEAELAELEKKSQNLELYGLTMNEIKREVGNIHRNMRPKGMNNDPRSPIR